MRWLSRFAILFYLSVLCTPQAFAVHDVRFSPVAEAQFQALLPALPVHTVDNTQNSDDEPPVYLTASGSNVSYPGYQRAVVTTAVFKSAPIQLQHRARAPPALHSA